MNKKIKAICFGHVIHFYSYKQSLCNAIRVWVSFFISIYFTQLQSFIPVTLDVQSFTVYFKMGKEEHKGKPVREVKKNRAMKQLSSSISNSFLTNKVSSHANTAHVEIHLPDILLPQTSSFIISLDNYATFFSFGVICDGSEHLVSCFTQGSFQLIWRNKCHFRNVLFCEKVMS